MDFKTYWQGLEAAARETFAKDVGTSVGYCHQIAYGGKRIELGLADAIVAHTGLTLDDLPLTDRAIFQQRARKGLKAAPPVDSGPANGSPPALAPSA
jgi:hypothetical protein